HDPIRMLGTFIDRLVLRLRRADDVIEKLLVVNGVLQLLTRLGLRESRIEKTTSILRPTHAAALEPAHGIAELFPGLELAHEECSPVRTAFRDSIREIPPVWRRRESSESNGPVRGERIRIDHELRGPA